MAKLRDFRQRFLQRHFCPLSATGHPLGTMPSTPTRPVLLHPLSQALSGLILQRCGHIRTHPPEDPEDAAAQRRGGSGLIRILAAKLGSVQGLASQWKGGVFACYSYSRWLS